MSLINKKTRRSISALELSARRMISLQLKPELSLNRRLYNLAQSLFDILRVGQGPRNKQQETALILLAKGTEYIRAVRHLAVMGYISQSAALAANAIEISLYLRKIKRDGENAANQWDQNDGTKVCWQITGKQGLFEELGEPKFEAHYRNLCAIKHSQGKMKHLNYSEEGSKRSVFTAPIVDVEKIRWALAYTDGSIERAIGDSGEILRPLIDMQKYEKWQNKFVRLRKYAVEQFQKSEPRVR